MPSLGISEENKVRSCSAQGEKDIGQAVDFLALVLLCTGDKIRYDGHNEIAQRKRPVHTGDKPDDGHDNAHDRDTPALMYFCDHQQINRPGKQSTPGGHEKGQHRVGSKKTPPTMMNTNKSAVKIPVVTKSLTDNPAFAFT